MCLGMWKIIIYPLSIEVEKPEKRETEIFFVKKISVSL
jgi:hypothetical protein